LRGPKTASTMIRRASVALVTWVFLMPAVQSETSMQQQVARAASDAAVHRAFDWFRAHEREIADLQLELARIPAPPFHEAKRAEWLRRQFISAGLSEVRVDSIGNVLGMLPGSDAHARCLALSAHLDTVFPAGTSLAGVRRGDDGKLHGPGISDNAAGVVALLAIARAVHESGVKLAAPVLFIGNVGEEGEGDLRGMRHIYSDPALRNSIAALIVVDGAGVDTMVTQALGSRRFEVTVHGPGGHSWSDFGAPNPIVVLARAIDVFSETSVSASPKTTFNVGVISGGTSVNSIPESATMRVDIRSSSMEEIERVEQALRRSVNAAVQQASSATAGNNGAGGQVAAEIRQIGSRPAADLPENSHLLQVLRAVDAHLGIQSHTHRASTDANIPISLGGDAVAIGAGGTGSGAHTIHEWYDPRGRDVGLKRLLLAVVALGS
jgi:tripeptide aminopeptidase